MCPPADAAKNSPNAYEALLGLADNVVGEIISGSLVVSPRPSGPHLRVTSSLNRRIGSPYDDGIGGPGGWWILEKPEVEPLECAYRPSMEWSLN